MERADNNLNEALSTIYRLDSKGSLGPIADLKAFALPAAACHAADRGEEIDQSYENLHTLIVNAIETNSMGKAVWAQEFGTWLEKAKLRWPEEIKDQKKSYVLWLNRCSHLRSLAKYEANWAYYNSQSGEIGEVSRSACQACNLMVEAYYGLNFENIQTKRGLQWYLDNESEYVADIHNTGARVMLWSLAAALRSGNEYTEYLHTIARLREREGDSVTVKGSLFRGLSNLNKLKMSKEAEEAAKILIKHNYIDRWQQPFKKL